MKVEKPWAKAFDINTQQLTQWSEMAPSASTLTFWAVESQKIDPARYFAWAKNHYQLAMLKPAFFQNEVNTDLWLQLQSVANWSPELLPVAEWDGVIFVACVEPRDDIQWSFPVRYLLARPQDLRLYWSLLSEEHTRVQAKPSSVQLRPPLPEKETLPPKIADEAITETITEHPPEVPEGLFDELSKAPILNLSQLQEDSPGLPTDTSTKAPAESVEAPEGLSLSITPTPTRPPLAEMTPAPPPVGPPAELQNTQTSSGGLLDQFGPQFHGALILLLKGDELEPLTWDSAWTPSGEAMGPENLLEASAFRIVARTKHPYLGHVVDTPINRKFFETWGFNQFPDKILVQPITQGGTLKAMFVALCDPSVKNHTLLSAGRDLAEKLSAALSLASPIAA